MAPRESSIRPAALTVEHRLPSEDAVDIPNPRLGWIVEATGHALRGARQTAWQIQAAATASALRDEKNLLWDTGKVVSDETVHHRYRGQAPASCSEVWWRVRVWDENGRASEWVMSFWHVGILDRAKWKASWIEAPAQLDFDRVRWIWHPEDELTREGARRGIALFKQTIKIGKSKNVLRAEAIIAAKDTVVFRVNGKEVSASRKDADTCRSPLIADFAEALKAGDNELIFAVECLNSGDAAGLAAKVIVQYDDQTQEVLPTNRTWKAAWKDSSKPTWKAARPWTTIGEMGDWVDPLTRSGYLGKGDPLITPPVSTFRHQFRVEGRVQSATLYYSVMGIASVQVNEAPADGSSSFNTGWTDYRTRVHYRRLPLKLQPGANEIRMHVADGWYSGYVGFCRRRNHYDGERKVLAQLHILYEDGRTEVIAADSSWDVSDEGPWRRADLLIGETYDARREEFRGFVPALRSEQPKVEIAAAPHDPVVTIDRIQPKHLSEPRPGVFVIDFGQNIVGRVKISGAGGTLEKGAKVRLRHAEVLDEDGLLYTDALRGANATDTYIAKDGQPFQWAPRFTFHGFRFVEVTGLCKAAFAVEAEVLGTRMDKAGDFVTSNELVNRIHANTLWSQRGNYLEVPTDCPQRDERLGWTGDAQIFVRAGSYNTNIAPFFTKWLRDLFDTQRQDGGLHNVAPAISLAQWPEDVERETSCAGWQDAAIVCPYTIWKVYGDAGLIETYWPNMVRYMEHLAAIGDDHVQPDFGFADWLNLNAPTPAPLLGTAYYARNALFMAEMAKALGKKTEAAAYAKLYQSIRAKFIASFTEADGQVAGHTQTACALALNIGLVEEAERSRLQQFLVQDLAYRGNHFSTGFLGLKELFPALTDAGRHDIACDVLLQEDFPSWGYQIRHGATTIWERWDGWSEDLGLQTPHMNSFNHYAFGAVVAWLVGTMAGIDTIGPGFKRIRLSPRLDPRVRSGRVRYRSIRGWIHSEWSLKTNGALVYVARIPANTTAEIVLPVADASAVSESGKAAAKAKGLKLVHNKSGAVTFEAQPGHYRFRATSEKDS